MSVLKPRIEQLTRRLADERSRRVVFLSHCLLNQNVRYLGGAFHPGVVPEAVNFFICEGAGLYQMPCPEQIAWGGVLKRFILRFYGAEGTWIYKLRGILLPLFQVYTRWVYRPLAERVVGHIEDYMRSGFEVVGIVGVGDSPSCGVRCTLDLERSLPIIASCAIETIERQEFNKKAVAACIADGEGMYMQELRRRLDQRGLNTVFLEYDVFSGKLS
jgi:predicted secreted protein